MKIIFPVSNFELKILENSQTIKRCSILRLDDGDVTVLSTDLDHIHGPDTVLPQKMLTVMDAKISLPSLGWADGGLSTRTYGQGRATGADAAHRPTVREGE